MKSRWTLLPIFFLALFTTSAECAPLEAYGKLPKIENVVISPDGAQLASVVTDGDNRAISVITTDGFHPIGLFPAGAAKIRFLQWAGPDHLIVGVSAEGRSALLTGGLREWFLAIDLNLKTGKTVNILDDPRLGLESHGETLDAIAGQPMVRFRNGRALVYVAGVHFESARGNIALFEYNPASNTARQIRPGDPYIRQWLVDGAGNPLAATRLDDRAGRWSLLTRRDGLLSESKVLSERIEAPFIKGLGRDGISVLLHLDTDMTDGSRHDLLVEMALGDKDWGAPFVDRDYDGLLFDPVTGALIGMRTLVDQAEQYQFFAPSDQAIWNGAAKAYPGARVDLVSISADHHKLVLLVDSPSEGQAFALVDIDTGRGKWLGGTYDAAVADIAVKTPISFQASDGLPLTGYITVPRGREARNLPLVVLAHGGPATRDAPGFDWMVQAIASRGYAVLQVNFRGSYGFGWNFVRAGFGEFGRRMQTDLSDGVRYLSAQGTIDPKRVCIVGGGYGGYAALAGAALDPGVYRCAVSVGGPSDLRRLVNWSSDENGEVSERYWLRFMGVNATGDPKLDEISPVRHVDKVAAPILLIHPKQDSSVDFTQSKMMYDALKGAAKDVELVTLAQDDQNFLTGTARLQMLQAIAIFLEKHNPAQ